MAHRDIVSFLVERFSEDELRELVTSHYPTLVPTLPGPTASRVEIAERLVAKLARNGILDEEFFAVLWDERKRFAEKIDALRREWEEGGRATESPTQPTLGAQHVIREYRWLHISDLHIGSREDAEWNQLKETFEESLEESLAQVGSVDFILLTGDLTFSGARIEFDLASRFLDDMLARITKITKTRPLVIPVPGNHEVQRPSEPLGRLADLDHYSDTKSPLAGALRERLWAMKDVGEISSIFAEYRRWFDGYIAPQLKSRPSHHVQFHKSHFPGDLMVVVNFPERFPLGFVGLNTAWLQYRSGDAHGKLGVPIQQFQAALPGGLASLRHTEIHRSLLLMHHPVSWFTNEMQSQFYRGVYVPRRFSAVLYGHMHTPALSRISTAGGEDRCFYQSPSLFGLEQYGTNNESRLFGYTIGALQEDGAIRLWPMRCSAKADGVWTFSRDESFHWKDEGHVEWRPPDGRLWSSSRASRLDTRGAPQTTDASSGEHGNRSDSLQSERLLRYGITIAFLSMVALQTAAWALLYINTSLFPFAMAEAMAGLFSWRLSSLVVNLLHRGQGVARAQR